MYTGIVQGIGKIVSIIDEKNMRHLCIELPIELAINLTLGASVSVDGVCLTVTKFTDTLVYFDLMEETLKRTTLSQVEEGDYVNIERSAKIGDECGGHDVSGHVDGTVKIVNVESDENKRVLTFQIDPNYMKYIFDKGFIALNGCSLTIYNPNKDESTFKVGLIPKTLELTTFSEKDVGSFINFEIERKTQIMVDSIMRNN